MAHFGETLRLLIDRAYLQDKEFCVEARISADTLYRNLRSPVPVSKKATYREMAKALNITTQQLDAAWMEEAANAATPAKPQSEKPPMSIDEIVAAFERLSPRKRRAVHVMLGQLLEPVAAQNAGTSRSLRTSRKTA